MNELENTPSNIWDFLKVFVPLAMLFSLVWRYIDKSYADRKAERDSALAKVGEEAGKAAAKEVIKDFTLSHIQPMETRMQKIEESQDRMEDRIDELYKR